VKSQKTARPAIQHSRAFCAAMFPVFPEFLLVENPLASANKFLLSALESAQPFV
jgi:hypothetical protein